MPFVLSTYLAADTDYVAKMNSDNRAIESKINELSSLVQNTFGDGAMLIDDVFPFDGPVGEESFQLDVPNYGGGSEITIGRRPTISLPGEVDRSVAYMTAGGNRHRIVKVGDTTLDAVAIVDDLPKPIYIVLSSGGDLQFEETGGITDLLYLYKMTWNGFSLTDFVRMAPILPGYQALKRAAAPMLPIQLFDSETQFSEDVESVTMLTIPGSVSDESLGIQGAFEVLGGFVTFNKSGIDGALAAGESGPLATLTLEIQSDAVKWNLGTFEMQMDLQPDTKYWRVDEAAVGLDRFVIDYREFRLIRAAIGANVVSARAFTWGLYVRPIFGAPVAKDTTRFDMI